MTPAALFRTLTPLGWMVLAAVVVLIVALLGPGLGFRWDPFDLTARRLATAQTQAQAARSDAAARRLEVQGAAEAALRVDAHHQTRLDLERATGRAEARARNAHDAETPLDVDRIARLADHDRELCRLSPAICPAATLEPAPGRD